jgi:hypothetical protein
MELIIKENIKKRGQAKTNQRYFFDYTHKTMEPIIKE